MSSLPRITVKNGKEYVFDIVRKKDIVLTPEEWVRQQILHYLVFQKLYPASLLSVEKKIKVGQLNKRYDIVVYHHEKPWLIVECKGENESLNEQTLQQILAYQSNLGARYLALSNGREVAVFNIKLDQWETNFPDFPTD